MPDRELSFVKRHFGTDVLAAGWLLLLATFFYTAYSVLFLIEMWGDTFPRVFFAWDNLIASLVFVVAGVYFALLGYPAELEEFEPSSPGPRFWLALRVPSVSSMAIESSVPGTPYRRSARLRARRTRRRSLRKG